MQLVKSRRRINPYHLPITITYSVSEQSGYFSFLNGVKDYFDVDNSYVLHKLRIILFPVTLKVSNLVPIRYYRLMTGKEKMLAMISTMKN